MFHGTNAQGRAPGFVRRLVESVTLGLSQLLQGLKDRRQRKRDHELLCNLSNQMLRDIGLNPSDFRHLDEVRLHHSKYL